MTIIKNREKILSRAKKYENNKEKLREPARNKYRELSEKENDIKRKYGKNTSHNMSKEKKKQGLKQYQKNYCEANRSKMS